MLRFLKIQEGWLTVGLLALLLFSVTLSIEQAQWYDGLTILTPITIIGLLTGLILAKIRGVPRILLDLVGVGVGLITVLLYVTSIMKDPRLVTVQDRVHDLLARTVTWVGIALRQDMSDDLVVFVLSLAVVCWVLSYSSTYFVFKARQLWWALVPNGIALLINISYSSVDLKAYLIIFMLAALLLMIRFNLLVKEERWQRERVHYSPSITWGFLWGGTILSTILALAMWYVPASPVNSTLNSMWEKVNQPWLDFQETMSKLWSQVPGNSTVGGYSAFNQQFTMGGSLSLSDQTALIIRSKERTYWRAMTYDQYDGSSWRNTSASSFDVPNLSPKLALDANQQLTSDDQARVPVTYTVTVVNPKGDTIFAALRPVRMDQPTRLEVSWRKLNDVYDLDSIYADPNSPDMSNVPLELRGLLGLLHEAQRELKSLPAGSVDPSAPLQSLYKTSKGDAIQQEVDNLSKRGVTVFFHISAYVPYAIQVSAQGQVPVYDDLSAVHATDPLPRNSQYTVVSLLSDASDDELRNANTNYDSWLDRYLALPASVLSPVRDLARQVVTDAGATNPFDEAKAIETYLRTHYTYSTHIPLPPPGVDRVEWFLFDGKQGYCEYYAAAMVVMLRTLGVPARMATGYAPGDYDPATNTYTVKESAAHAWPEVYFPSYGWIEFEPTPSQAVPTRELNSVPDAGQPTPEPSPGAQPSPTAGPNNPELPTRGPLAGGSLRDNGGGGLGRALFATVVLALGVFGILAIWLPNTPWKRKRVAATAGFYYAQMLRWARRLRLGPAAHQTPYEFADTLAREVPGSSTFARNIARAYVRERYSPYAPSLDERTGLDKMWDSLRSMFVRSWPARLFRRLRIRGRK